MNDFPTQPVSRHFGFDRGLPIDRYYIEAFLEQNKMYIKGHVLEIGDRTYTEKFGSNVVKSDILDISPSKITTIIGNLETGENVPISTFDCIILTQVIHMIYDMKSALTHIMNALKPGGVLLLTTSGINKYCDKEEYGDYWRFTSLSLKRLLLEVDNQSDIFVESFGNIAVAKAFLDGLALHEIPKYVLEFHDYEYQVLLAATVKKII